jgi:hypothetical protein
MKEGVRQPSDEDKLKPGQVIIHEHLSVKSEFESKRKTMPWGSGVTVNIRGVNYELLYTKKVFKGKEHGDSDPGHQDFYVAVDWVAARG